MKFSHVEINEHDNEMLNSDEKEITTADPCLGIFKLHMLNLKFPGSNSLMVAPNYIHLLHNSYRTYMNILQFTPGHTLGLVSIYGGKNNPQIINYTNKSSIVLSGIDQIDKIFTGMYNWIYVENSTNIERSIKDDLMGRLIDYECKEPFSQIIFNW